MTYSRKASGNVNKNPVGDEFVNNTGSFLNKATPIAVDTVTGYADLVDVSDPASKSTFALVAEDVDVGNTGTYVTSGRIEDVSISANFGDDIFVSKSGSLTNVAPATGVGGFVSDDFCIYVGTIKKNTTDPTKKDLLVNIDIRGQLE